MTKYSNVVIITNGHFVHYILAQKLKNLGINFKIYFVRPAKLIKKGISKINVIKFPLYLSHVFFIFFDLILNFFEYRIPTDSKLIYNVVNDVNSEDFFLELEQDGVDLILLAGAPILKGSILNSKKFFILNSHPGDFLNFRGSDVIFWALKERSDITITLHKVTKYIDKGEELMKHKIELSYFRKMDFKQVQFYIYTKAVELMVNFIENGVCYSESIANHGSLRTQMSPSRKILIRFKMLFQKL